MISYNEFAALGDMTPVSRKLSLLIRPTFIARPGHLFVWSDWSQIEARVLPWLVGDDPGANARLQIFRDVDADPSLPDLYTRTAAALSHVAIEDVTKPMRQRGKVAELALGFMGGLGALQSMAAGYGLYLPDDEGRTIVDRWRAANPWCRMFADAVWATVQAAQDRPGVPVNVGRISLIFMRDYLEGSLLMVLPSGRMLTYRKMKWERVAVLDDDDQPTGETRVELTCARGYGRIKLWPGLFLENMTQATAADFLRGTLVRLEEDLFDIRLHTHDEILAECPEAEAERVRNDLRYEMQLGFDWSKGLPIMSEETISPYYTKVEFKEAAHA